jgi:putative transposase
MIGEHPAIRRPLLSAVGLSRASLYYEPKQPAKDWVLKQEIEAVLREHPAYGHKRIALVLKRNKKSILRVMKIFGIKPYRRRGKKWRKPKAKSGIFPNLLLTTTPVYPHHIWVADFTHLVWKNKVIYVATVMDVFTRRIVGLSVLTTHHAVLVVQALWNALFHNPPPLIFHSDNGSEYDAAATREILSDFGILISRSAPGCPWENGYQESFYDKFKLDLGDPNRFRTLGELVAEIYRTIHAYNTMRIHTAIKMPPAEFAKICGGGMIDTTVDLVS